MARSHSGCKPAGSLYRKSQAVPVLSAAGLLALTGGATVMAAVDLPADAKANHVVLSKEVVSDVSLATFYVFDKERAAPPAFTLARACGRCGGCARCAVGACAGCGCGCGSYCLSMGGCNASC
jgi:hypothetical protein